MILSVDPTRCCGCRTCEVVCSLWHEGECTPAASRVQVVRFEEGGAFVPLFCQQCQEPLCQRSCPMGAIARREADGALVVDERRCVGCLLCLQACPLGACVLHPERRIVLKCDLCDGDPQCVRFCPTEALECLEADQVGARRRRERIAQISRMLSLIEGRHEG